jgi:ABC-2 type transport system ATP-binding protein
MHAIEAISLEKRFGTVQALAGISFSVEEGETFGFLGPNGAGKTTTIRILTGMTEPSAGFGRIFGRDVVREKIPARRNIGIVHETSNIYTDLSAWENLMFTARLYNVGKKERENRAQELLSVFGLADRKDERTKGFSKGMKRRLTIAMGLINNPRILFLDEPTSGLDVQSNLIIRDVIQRLTEEGVTIFLTTHNIEEANILCDRVAIINRGHIAAIDTPERLKKTIQSVQSIEVAFDPSGVVTTADLAGIEHVTDVKKLGDKFRLVTGDPPEVIEGVTEFARRSNLRIISITTLGPSLEDVFIRLTGLDRDTKGGKTLERGI